MNTFGDNLRKAMEKAEINATELSEKTGISKSTISRYLSGGYIAKQKNLLKLSLALQVEPKFLFSDAVEELDANLKVYSIPLVGKVVAGTPIDAIENITDYIRVTNPAAADGSYYALHVTGASMEPEMREGDLVIVHKQDYFDSGDICIVLVNGDEATVKKVIKSDQGITLIGFNATVYPPHFYNVRQVEELPVRVIGKVKEVRRSY
ncbi:XRE family transcriptional regulator [Dialister hominis]|uniref:LexA family protein n=1 Tax=Dialister hominis TaxID=2582419 RepID=UPI00307FAD9D